MSKEYTKSTETLSVQDVKFCKLIMQQDRTNMDCYLEAFPKFAKRKYETNKVELCKYLKLPKIKAEFERMAEEIRKQNVMSLQEKLEFLRAIVENPSDKTSDKIKAIELSAKLQHMFTQKIEHSGAITQTHNATPELIEALDKLFE